MHRHLWNVLFDLLILPISVLVYRIQSIWQHWKLLQLVIVTKSCSLNTDQILHQHLERLT